MAKLSIFFTLLFLASCATKYVVPGNRFITPESQGGIFRGQVEIQKTQGHELKIDGSNGTVEDGVIYNDIPRVGYLASTSIFDAFDLVWAHVGNGNSLVGGKFQFMGASRLGKGTGQKMSFAALFGGNEHETDDSIEFRLSGQEYLLLYGYRTNEYVLPYTSFSFSKYDFSGKIREGDLAGQEPNFVTRIMAINGGIELSVYSIFIKAEGSYQKLKTSNTKEKTGFGHGVSLGVNW